jgi:hypothetical protein
MPIMGVQVIPAPHGKATSYVTDAMEAHVHGFDKAGGEVGLVCTDGDITYVHKVGSRFALLAAPENYRLELPVHMPGEIRMKSIIPDTRAIYCFDMDHQGKGLRDLITKGRSVTVFPRYSCADVAFGVDADILRGVGVPQLLCVGVSLARWMIIWLPSLSRATIWSWLATCCANRSVYSAAPLSVMASLSRTASDALQAEVEGVVGECAAAYWLIAPMACVYQTMHVELAPADRLFAASYGFCVALLMIDMRRFVDPAFLRLQRHTTTSAERRWVYNDETWKKLMDHESC